MEKNDIFKFTAPNGVEVTGIVIYAYSTWVSEKEKEVLHICYAQNRLFTYLQNIIYHESILEEGTIAFPRFGKTLVEYCVIPELDELLERYNDIEVAKAETAMGM